MSPYRNSDRAERLLDRTSRVVASINEHGRHTGGVNPEARAVPDVYDVDSYVQRRVQSQIDGYYGPKAKRMDYRLRWAGRAEFVLALAAAALGAVATVTDAPQVSVWIAVVTTVSGAVAAHVAVSRWEFQLIEFQRTALQLKRLIARRHASLTSGAPLTPDHDDRFVADCERVISIENEGWMARWTASDSDQAGV